MPLTRKLTASARGGMKAALLLPLLAGVSTVSACAVLPGDTQATNSDIQGTFPVTVSGLPAHLEAQAATLLGQIPKTSRSVLEARRYAQKASEDLSELLAAEGYFSAEVSMSPITSRDETPHLSIKPKTRFTIASVAMSGIDEIDPATRTALNDTLRTLSQGSVAQTSQIEALESQLVQRLRQSGYAFAGSDTIDALASRQSSTLELTYILTPGPRVRMGAIVPPKDGTIAPDVVFVMQTWKPGDLYKPETLEQLRKRVRSAGLFEGIGVQLSETAGQDGLYPVKFSYTPAKLRTISAGLSYSTSDSVGASASWTRRNLTGKADTLTAEIEAATINSHASLSYVRPNIGRFGRNLTLAGGLRHEETDAYDLNGARVSAAVSQPFNKQFTVSVGTTLDATRTRTVADATISEQVSLSFPVTATYSTVEAPLDPQDGNTAFLGIEPGLSTGSDSGYYTRVLTSATTYKTLAPDLIGAVRGEIGAYFGDDDVPPDRRFFSGGGGSVRGYEYQSLSPRDSDNNIVGGTSLFNISTELRWRKSDRYGYVVFVDTGAAEDDLGEAVSNARSSFGLGLRYYPGFGPLRFDIATPIDRKDGEDPLQVYFSIGQSF